MHGFPLIGGIAVETEEAGALAPLPECGGDNPVFLPVTPEQMISRDWQPALQAVQRVLYASTDDVPLLTRPVLPDGYFGPGYDFRGAAEAIYAATFLYHNGPECGSHIDDAGTACCSKTQPSRNASVSGGYALTGTLQTGPFVVAPSGAPARD